MLDGLYHESTTHSGLLICPHTIMDNGSSSISAIGIYISPL